MASDLFNKRGSALEDEYFRRVDAKLAQELREKWQQERESETLQKESQISDPAVIQELLQVGIKPGMIQAMGLVPALTVAWANGFVAKEEHDAVLHAADSMGISGDSTVGQLLLSWLDHKPGPELFQAWSDYVAALHGVLEPAAYRHLHESAVQTAQKVAESAGGFLGLGAVSESEKRAIEKVNNAFVTA